MLSLEVQKRPIHAFFRVLQCPPGASVLSAERYLIGTYIEHTLNIEAAIVHRVIWDGDFPARLKHFSSSTISFVIVLTVPPKAVIRTAGWVPSEDLKLSVLQHFTHV
jgi:hypothetical protein